MDIGFKERIKKLRKERRLTLEQLEQETGLSRASLGRYESDDPKEVSVHAVITLAKFYGVTTDYLLGLSEQKNHPDAGVIDLHLSDEALNILRSGEINNRLLCEIITHKEFWRLLSDIEIYVDRIASAPIDTLNAWISVAREKVMEKYMPDNKDFYLRTLEAAYIQEDKYFTHSVHEDMDIIITDIRDSHKTDVTTADIETVTAKLNHDIEDTMQFGGSDQEKQIRIFCNQLDIPYD